jgi:phenylpropionate dioxygenase-like ring-hydroxylating dioxygenase large terminal subunit
MTDHDDIITSVRSGILPAHIYNDADLFAAERDSVFAKNWLCLAHESEVPDRGDYVVRQQLGDSFIVSRDESGEIRVMFNMCLHRGMQVCRAEIGNTSHFRCPYHGWTYKNDGTLVGVPFFKEAYGGDDELRRSDHSLLPAPAMEIVNGLVFICLDPDAPPISSRLGEFRDYLDFYTRPGPDGVEVRGPQRWRLPANWKIGAENFVGDTYHTPHTHLSVSEIGLMSDAKGGKRKGGTMYFAGGGGGATFPLAPGDLRSRLGVIGYTDEMIERRAETWPATISALIGKEGQIPSAATIFPNLSFLHLWARVSESQIVPFTTMRLWQPISAEETEVVSWFVVDKAADEEFKRASYKAYQMCFGPSGMFEQDDMENWSSITRVAGGTMARRLQLNNRMGLRTDDSPIAEPLTNFSGPGAAYGGFGEHNQRRWFDLWCRDLESGPIDTKKTTSHPTSEGDDREHER